MYALQHARRAFARRQRLVTGLVGAAWAVAMVLAIVALVVSA